MMARNSKFCLRLLERLASCEVCDADQEVFELFSNNVSSGDLGMLDAQATSVDLCIAGRDLTIFQNPGVLKSNRAGGTTGAVIWKASIAFADWIASASNILFEHSILGPCSTVLELGAGLGVLGLVLAPKIRRYILTDQDYMLKLIQKNIHENIAPTKSSARAAGGESTRGGKAVQPSKPRGEIKVLSLDWETSKVDRLIDMLHDSDASLGNFKEDGLDVIVACDCIFNDALVEPFVQTLTALCSLRASQDGDGDVTPTICILAQQLRSSEVFELWIHRMMQDFKLWRLEEPALTNAVAGDSLCVVHLAILRGACGESTSAEN